MNFGEKNLYFIKESSKLFLSVWIINFSFFLRVNLSSLTVEKERKHTGYSISKSNEAQYGKYDLLPKGSEWPSVWLLLSLWLDAHLHIK